MRSSGSHNAVERLDVQGSDDPLQVALHNQRYLFALDRISKEDDVLEIGTGLGFFTEMLLNGCKSVTGVEFDEPSYKTTSERVGSRARIIQGDAQQLPFSDESFSATVCLEVLEHLPNYRKAVAEIRRCLTSSGRAIISVPYRHIGGKNPQNPYHLYEPGETELTEEFRHHFEKVETFYQLYPETLLMTVARILHLRRVLGLVAPYAALTRGEATETSKLTISKQKRGLKICLILVATQPREKTL